MLNAQKTLAALTKKHPYLATTFPAVFEFIHRLLDGAYMGNSMLDYIAEIPTSSLDDANYLNFTLHHNPQDVGLAIAETTLFISLSLLANDNTKEHHSLLRYAHIYWPYIRNFCSGLKNGRHAAVNIGALAQHSLTSNLYLICNPLGIGIGAVYALALIWYHHQERKRTTFISHNIELYQKISNDLGWLELNEETKHHRYNKRQSVVMYAAAACDGMLDGLYMFGCLYLVMHISLLTIPVGWPLAIAAALIGIMAIVSFAAKMYHEYEQQSALEKSAAQCELALAKNNMLAGKISEEAYENQLAAFTKKYETPFQPHSKVGKALWLIARGFINGMKNSYAALESIGKFINNVIIVPVALAIVGVFYGLYLAAGEVKTAVTHIGQHWRESEKKAPAKRTAAFYKNSAGFGFFNNRKSVPQANALSSEPSFIPTPQPSYIAVQV